MTPDEQHAAYYTANPTGNHPHPSPETLRKFDAVDGTIKELQKKFEELKESTEERLKSCVTYEHFYWIIGVLLTIFIGVNTLIYQAVKDVSTDTNETKQAVSQIQGKLEPYNIEYKD